MHKSRCFCELIPSVETKTKLTLIIHYKEIFKTTNTGRLAVKTLKNSEMRVRGSGKKEDDERDTLENLLATDYQSLLFFPNESAVELTPTFIQSFSKPIQLIVPDGTWKQAGKVNSRCKELANIPRVKLTIANDPNFYLRKESSEFKMSTLEAIALAMGVIEGESTQKALMGVYQEKLNRTLSGRGFANKEEFSL